VGATVAAVVLQPDEAAALVALPGAQREVSVLRDRPLVAVDLRGGDGGADLSGLTHLPTVVVGIGPPHAACDVAVADDDQRAALEDAVTRNPQASVTLVQLLRIVAHLDRHAGLVAESLAYGTLQGGQEFATWLASRGARVRKPEAEAPVLVARHADHLTVELNRPRLHNLFNAAMRDALGEALAIASSDDSIRTVELSGRGPSFCAGGDPAEFGTVSDPATAHLIRTTANVAPLLASIADRVQVRVHGAAVGAGCELAAFARVVHATPDAVFRLPEVSMGLVPGAGGTVSVTRRIGRHRAAWMMLSGEPVDAPTAHAWGLVDAVV
jgi:hypothetical protein